MPWFSTVPAAVDALLAACRASDDLAGLAILDGPELNGSSAQEVLAVGYQSEETPVSVEGLGVDEGFSIRRTREQYAINGSITVDNGAAKPGVARTRAFQLYSAVGAVLAGNPKLDDTVMSTRLGTYTLQQTAGKRGARAYLQFTVDCDGWTTES
jgi:hypothetical protein